MQWESLFREHTPIKKYNLKGRDIYVKRDDLFGIHPAPPLAKLRGTKLILEKLQSKGINTVGISDSRVSKAGQGLAVLCSYRDPPMTAIVAYPKYKNQVELYPQQKIAQKCGAELYPIRANMTSVMYYQARNYVEKQCDGYMMPKYLICNETVQNVAKEAQGVPEDLLGGSLVICAGSGTITAGVICGLKKLPEQIFVISVGAHRNKRQTILRLLYKYGRYFALPPQLKVIIYPIDYYEEEIGDCPFPVHPNYDAKAWKWLKDNLEILKDPILFWNIGA